jgi:hypothetical protein
MSRTTGLLYLCLSLFGLLSSTEAFAQLPDTTARKLFFEMEPSSGNPNNLPVDTNSRSYKRKMRLANSAEKGLINWTNLPYFMDDLMFIGGLNRSDLHYSEDFKNIRVANGWNIGVENYYPLIPKAFLHYGLNISRQSFTHFGHSVNIRQLNLPLIMAYELPVFRNFDFRFLLGGQLSFFRRGEYEFGQTVTPDFNLLFDDRNFQSFDFGMNFGLSMEYNDFYGRLRNYTGTRKLDLTDTGMLSSWHIELGYFPFRKLRSVR